MIAHPYGTKSTSSLMKMKCREIEKASNLILNLKTVSSFGQAILDNLSLAPYPAMDSSLVALHSYIQIKQMLTSTTFIK